MKNARLVVTGKDVSRITGKSVKTGNQILREIRSHYKKKPWHQVSYKELATHLDLDPEDVKKALD